MQNANFFVIDIVIYYSLLIKLSFVRGLTSSVQIHWKWGMNFSLSPRLRLYNIIILYALFNKTSYSLVFLASLLFKNMFRYSRG